MIRTFFNPIMLLLTVMSLHWVAVGAGFFSITLPNAALLLCLVYAMASPRRVAGLELAVRANAAWILPFVLFLVLMTPILYGTDAINSIARQFFYLVGALAVAGSLGVNPDPVRLLRVGSTVALILFVIFVEILARRIGISWSDAISEFLINGNRTFAVYEFLRPVLNSFSDGSDFTISAAQKNGVAVCLLVLAFLAKAAWGRSSLDFLGWVIFVATLLVLFVFDTRSVLIVAALGALLAAGIREKMRPAGTGTSSIVAGAAIAVSLVLLLGYSVLQGPALESMSQRFAFEDQSTADRGIQYRAAFDVISAHPITGKGLFEVHGAPVHNLFLSSWAQGGIAAFALILAFYLLLLWLWGSAILQVMRQPKLWVLPIAFEWIAPLPLLLLVRVWISGDYGLPFLGEWIALAAFSGLLIANKLRLQAIVQAYRWSFGDIDSDTAAAGQVV